MLLPGMEDHAHSSVKRLESGNEKMAGGKTFTYTVPKGPFPVNKSSWLSTLSDPTQEQRREEPAQQS